MDRDLHLADRRGDAALVRIAAVGDLHVAVDSADVLAPMFRDLAERADALLLAGDLTQHGLEDEGRILAETLSRVPEPVVAVLGNHDYHRGYEDAIRADLESAGVKVLEGEGAILELGDGRTVGIAGAKGFGGGFAGACGTEFGEPEMKTFIRHTKIAAKRLLVALDALATTFRVVLTHYAPVPDTLRGEKLEIYPFLGSYLLGEAIDAAGCDLVFHGHAHHGTERGLTPGGIPVRNVARPVIQHAYKIYCLDGTHVRHDERAAYDAG